MNNIHKDQRDIPSKQSHVIILYISLFFLTLPILTEMLQVKQSSSEQHEKAQISKTQNWRKFSSGVEYIKFKMDVLRVVHPLIDDLKKEADRVLKHKKKLCRAIEQLSQKIEDQKKSMGNIIQSIKILKGKIRECKEK